MNQRISKSLLAVLMSASLVIPLSGCGNNNSSTTATTSQTAVKNVKSNDLAKLNYQPNTPAYVNVNGGKSTLKISDFKFVHVNYHNLDHLNRTGTNVAYLDAKNVANDSLRVVQTVKPTGYHQKFINGEAIINRGHEIAYSLSKGINMAGSYQPNDRSGDQNNPKNLFTQTAFSNQKVQTIFETKVRNALKRNQKVIYQVTPVFFGNDLMAKGVQLQAISLDKSLDFNVYVYNVQPGIKFDYATGRSVIDKNMVVPTPANAPKFVDHKTASFRPLHHHHYLRDYLIYRGIRHALTHHRYHSEFHSGFHGGMFHHHFR